MKRDYNWRSVLDNLPVCISLPFCAAALQAAAALAPGPAPAAAVWALPTQTVQSSL